MRPITRDNLWAVVDLKLHPGQEKFVEDNVASIANAYVEPTFVPLEVYAGDELVGFAMYGRHPHTGAWWVIRLMIDRAHQGKGYGRAAMEAVIEMMAEQVGCEEIVTSSAPSNAVAAGLYTSLGFRPTGEIEDGEPQANQRLAVLDHIGTIDGRPHPDSPARAEAQAVALRPSTGAAAADHPRRSSYDRLLQFGIPSRRSKVAVTLVGVGRDAGAQRGAVDKLETTWDGSFAEEATASAT